MIQNSIKIKSKYSENISFKASSLHERIELLKHYCLTILLLLIIGLYDHIILYVKSLKNKTFVN